MKKFAVFTFIERDDRFDDEIAGTIVAKDVKAAKQIALKTFGGHVPAPGQAIGEVSRVQEIAER